MIAIIGAGISGLSLAWHLEHKGIPYQVFESQSDVGGYLKSLREGEYLFEQGANSLLMDEDVRRFIVLTGFGREMIYANQVSKNRYIIKNGKPVELPSSPPRLITSSLFSWKTKYKVFKEYFSKPEVVADDATVGAFLESHFGKEVVDYVVSPFISGIYAANPHELLLEQTFPILKEYAQEHGSVLKGFIKNKTAERKKSVSFKEGLQSFVKYIATELAIKCNTKVERLVRKDGKWSLYVGNEFFNADKVVLTTPALPTAQLLAPHYKSLAQAIQNLDYPPMCLIHSVFKKRHVGIDLNGFGALHPKAEDTFSAGVIWSSSVFSNRAPKDEVLFTGFVGGEQWKENAMMEEKEIIKRHTEELKKIHKIKEAPVLQKFQRWEKSVPQYNHKLFALQDEMQALEGTSLHVLANWWKGVSLADCIKKSQQFAENLAD